MQKKEDLRLLSSVSSKYKLKTVVLYTYDLTKQPKSKAVRFVYLLKGRKGEKGIVNDFKGQFMAPGCFFIPIKKDKEMEGIFEMWKIPFKKKMYLTR